jgi:predicted phosphodiesterase
MNDIIILGDIHGDFNFMMSKIKEINIGNKEEITYLIQVGDFGIGFNDRNDQEALFLLNTFFESRNIIALIIRGNHDSPDYFKGNHIYSNLKLLEDYTTMTINDKKFLFVGGAISIDRRRRMRYDEYRDQKSYWVDEKFVLDDEKLKDMVDIDVVITHASPELCVPYTFGSIVYDFAKDDNNLLIELQQERRDLTTMYYMLKNNGCELLQWWNGHYHYSYTDMIYDTKFILLNINEFKELIF